MVRLGIGVGIKIGFARGWVGWAGRIGAGRIGAERSSNK